MIEVAEIWLFELHRLPAPVVDALLAELRRLFEEAGVVGYLAARGVHAVAIVEGDAQTLGELREGAVDRERVTRFERVCSEPVEQAEFKRLRVLHDRHAGRHDVSTDELVDALRDYAENDARRRSEIVVFFRLYLSMREPDVVVRAEQR